MKKAEELYNFFIDYLNDNNIEEFEQLTDSDCVDLVSEFFNILELNS